MLSIIVTKLLFNGAIKTFIIKPILNASMIIVPQNSVIEATLLNSNVLISTGDLIKFGAEALYDRFIGQRLEFQIEKLSKYVFGVSPTQEFAALFSKEYFDDEELIIDLTKFEDFLDKIVGDLDDKPTTKESDKLETDLILNNIIQDLDLAVSMSSENMFDDVEDEKLLVEKILDKNRLSFKKVNDLSDFPQTPGFLHSEEDEIEKILHNFTVN